MSRSSQLIRAIGVPAFALTLVNTIVGSGIFGLPAAAAAAIGPAAALGYIGCALLVGLVALCFAESGSRVPETGGTYAWARAAFGPAGASSIGYLMAFANLAGSNAAVGALLVATLRQALPGLPPIAAPLVLGLIYLLLVITNIRGVKSGARVSAIAAAIKVIPLIVFIAAGLFFVKPENLRMGELPSASSLGLGMVVLFFAFMGTEGPLSTLGEVREPSRTIPRALGLAVLATGTLYLLVHVTAQGLLGPDLARASVTPLADAAAVAFGAPGRTFLLWGAILSTAGYFTADVLSSPRMICALGEDGMLPRILGRVHPVYRTPHVAIVAYVAFCAVLAVTGTFRSLVIFASAGTLVVYLASVLGLLRLRARGVRAEAPPFVVPGGPIVPILASLVIIGLLLSLTRKEQLATLALAVAGCIPGLVAGRARRAEHRA